MGREFMDKIKLTEKTYDGISKIFADTCNGLSDKIDLSRGRPWF